jgi:hypothetical protein
VIGADGAAAPAPDWFHRTVQETAAVTPGARLVMMEG